MYGKDGPTNCSTQATIKDAYFPVKLAPCLQTVIFVFKDDIRITTREVLIRTSLDTACQIKCCSEHLFKIDKEEPAWFTFFSRVSQKVNLGSFD
jgi:hypothetical protein